MYLTSRKIGSYVLIGSVSISYILKALCHLIHNVLFSATVFDWTTRVLILSILSFVLSLCFVYVSEIKTINGISLLVNHKSLHDDIWNDVIDYKNGTTLRIVCNDATYTGILAGHEEKGLDSWFILSDYIIEENGSIQTAEDISHPSRLAINLKNVKRIELYYGDMPENKNASFIKSIIAKIKRGK